MFTKIVTADHVRRVASLSLVIGQEIGLMSGELQKLAFCAAVHDLGKIGVPDSILLKPGPLTTRERNAVELHTLIGAELLSGSERVPEARLAALTHHERWSGGGYPSGLAGEDIPLFGRIISIADVFDALTSARPYKEAYPDETALRIIRQERGRHFDPYLVDAFLGSLPPVLRLQ